MKKNILIVFSNLMNGGAQYQQLKILNNINNDQYNFYICCLKDEGPLASEYRLNNFKIFPLNMKSRFSIHRLIVLFRLFKKLKIDIVYTKGGGNSLFWGRLIGYLAGVSRIISSIHTTGNFIGDKPSIRGYNHLISFLPTEYICVCKFQRDYCRKHYHFKQPSIRVIYNGVELKKIDCRISAKLRSDFLGGDNRKIIGIVAALEEHKNHKMFLDAASLVIKKDKNTLFMIIGDGSLKTDLINYAQEKDIGDNVKFLGYKKNILEYISIMDAVVLTSKTEAFPNCLLEGMSQAKPIIATRVGGTSEMVWHGKNGFLVEVDDYMDLSEKIVKIVKNPDQAKKMGEKSLEYCKKYFDIKAKAKEFVDLLSIPNVN